MAFDAKDAEFLLSRGEFRRFLLAAIQTAGILGQSVSASAAQGRDLGHLEGRRALGFDLLLMAHAGQSEAVRGADPDGMVTLSLCLAEASNHKDTVRERRANRDAARYDELPAGG